MKPPNFRENSILKFKAPLFAIFISLPAFAQSSSQLREENIRLKSQLQALQQQCGNPDQTGVTSRTGSLNAKIDAIRIGAATGFVKNTIAITTTMTLTNTGSTPLAINYEQYKYSITDNNGYSYKLDNEFLTTAYKKDIKGIPMATDSRASTTSVLSPSASMTVTFIAVRYMDNGQTPGDHFDINATFGQYVDEGQGRIRKVRDFPVAFTNVPASGGPGLSSGSSTGAAAGQALDKAAGKLLDKIFK